MTFLLGGVWHECDCVPASPEWALEWYDLLQKMNPEAWLTIVDYHH